MLEDFQTVNFFGIDNELFKECLSLRHQTFVEETKIFESEGEDFHDKNSRHILLKHLPSDRYIGCARLILNKPTPTMSKLVVKKEYREYYNKLKYHDVAEISRLCIPRDSIKDLDLKILPSLPLFIGIIEASLKSGITHWTAHMEKRLNKLLKRYGLDLHPIGDEQEYFGKRVPYMSKIEDVIANVWVANQDLYYSTFLKDIKIIQGRLFTMITVKEAIERLQYEDEDYVVELLELNSEEILNRFSDVVAEKLERISLEIEDLDEHDDLYNN